VRRRAKAYCYGGAEDSKGGDEEEEKDATRLLRCRTRWRPWEHQARIRAAALRRGRDATATRLLARFLHAVAPVGAPSAHSCCRAEERKGCDGGSAATFAHAVAPVVAPSATTAGLYGEWRDCS
jgi:hypothetical protein